MDKDRGEEKATWETNIPGRSPETGECLLPSRNSKETNVAGAMSKENSRGWDQSGKGGGRRDPVRPWNSYEDFGFYLIEMGSFWRDLSSTAA